MLKYAIRVVCRRISLLTIVAAAMSCRSLAGDRIDPAKQRSMSAQPWPDQVAVGEQVDIAATLTYAVPANRYFAGDPSWTWSVADSATLGIHGVNGGTLGPSHIPASLTGSSAHIIGLRPGKTDVIVNIPARDGYPGGQLRRTITVKASPYQCTPREFPGDSASGQVTSASCQISATQFADVYRFTPPSPGLYQLTTSGPEITVHDLAGFRLASTTAPLGAPLLTILLGAGPGPYLIRTTGPAYSITIRPVADPGCGYPTLWLLPGAVLTRPANACHSYNFELPPMTPMRLSV
jgi:hypothetical protein